MGNVGCVAIMGVNKDIGETSVKEVLQAVSAGG